jgi:hypothetical protein
MLLLTRLGFAVGEAAEAPTATSWIAPLVPDRSPKRSKRSEVVGRTMPGARHAAGSGAFHRGPNPRNRRAGKVVAKLGSGYTAAPRLGQDSDAVLSGILGMGERELERLRRAGAIA